MPPSKIPSFIPGVSIVNPRMDTVLRGGTITNRLYLRDPAPCVTILIHGVNDAGETYAAQEAGLCEGLNQRLKRNDLASGKYRLPKEDRSDALEADPDATYYQRGLDDQLYTPVIPFYWGFREEEGLVAKSNKHGEKTDRYGNRLDARGIKQGGPFSNATTTIADLWSKGFETTLGGLTNAYKNDALHPILKCPPRHYMVLGAKRLAMLIGLIRDAHEADAVNIVAHSQGCLLTLLAQAFLEAEGKHPADCLILNHPPYSLHTPFMEKIDQGDAQQTVSARLETLINLVKLVTAKPQAKPGFGGKGYYRDKDWESEALRDWRTQDAHHTPAKDEAYTFYNPDGQSAWLRKVEGVGPQALPSSQHFAVCGHSWRAASDRDNRGKVYLYFCPEDSTVGLKNVQGIGWQGVPDEVSQLSGNYASFRHLESTKSSSALSIKKTALLASLGPRFKQRVFPLRKREGQSIKVGQAPHAYTLCTQQEASGFWPAQASFTADPPVNHTRQITGEALPKPCEAQAGSAQLSVSPLDAAVAVTNRGLQTWEETIADPLGARHPGSPQELPPLERTALESKLNAGKAKLDQRTVIRALRLPNGALRVTMQESPNEARLRWQSKETTFNSYHSAIVSAQRHSQEITAYDLAIAPSYTASNREFFEFLCLVADWRVGAVKSGKNEKLPRFEISKWFENAFAKKYFPEIAPAYQQLIRDTYHYVNTGVLPASILNCPMPPGVVSETIGQVKKRGGA